MFQPCCVQIISDQNNKTVTKIGAELTKVIVKIKLADFFTHSLFKLMCFPHIGFPTTLKST